MLKLLASILVLLAVPALAQQPPTLEARMFQVCQEQRNAALTWHAGAEAQRAQLTDEISALRVELVSLRMKIKELETKNGD